MSGMTYDPKKLVATFGVIPITGLAEGDAITFEPASEGVTAKVGVAGEWAFNKSADQSGRLTIRLMATSVTNALLEAAEKAGIPAPMTLTSLTTRESLVAGLAMITRSPPRTFGAEVGVREWVFISGEWTVL